MLILNLLRQSLLICITATLLSIPEITKATAVRIGSKLENNTLSVIFSHSEDAFPVINYKKNGTIILRFYRTIASVKADSASLKIIKWVQEDKKTIRLEIIPQDPHLKHEIKIGKTHSTVRLYLGKEEQPANQKHISINLDTTGIPVIKIQRPQAIAIFKKRKELWIVLHKASRETQSLPKDIIKFRQIKADECFAMACDMSKLSYLKLQYGEETPKFILGNNQIESHDIDYKELPEKHFWQINSEYKTCKIYDEVTNEYIDIVLIKDLFFGIRENRNFANFSIQSTIQGAQFLSKTSKLQLIKEKGGVSIAMASEDNDSESSLPWSCDGSFFLQKQELEEASKNANTSESQQLCRGRLISLHFSKSHYHEAAYMLNCMQDAEISAANLRLMQAVSNYLIGDISAARRAIHALSLSQKPKSREFLFWINLIQGEDIQKSFLTDIQNFVSEYYDEAYWKLVFDYLEQSLSKGYIRDAEALLNKIRSSSTPRVKEKLNYYKTIVNYQMGKKQQTSQILENLVSTSIFDEIKMMAKMQLVKIKYADSQISSTDAIKALEDCIMIRENENLEKALLLQIADLYQDQNDLVAELRTLKYIKDFLDSDPLCTFRMDKLYTKIFLTNKVLDTMPSMSQLAIFYEFQSLAPTGNLGDLVALKIAKHLYDLDLLDQAEEILEHQVKHRMVGRQKTLLSEHLACVFLANNKAEKAMSVLGSLESSSFAEHQRRLRLKAIAAMENGEYDTALEFLFKDVSKEGFIITKEILFRANKWAEYINLTTPEILSFITSKNAKISATTEQDMLRFVTSCIMTKNLDKISTLISNINTIDANFANLLASLQSDHPLESYAQLNKALNVNQIDTILNQYKFELQNFTSP